MFVQWTVGSILCWLVWRKNIDFKTYRWTTMASLPFDWKKSCVKNYFSIHQWPSFKIDFIRTRLDNLTVYFSVCWCILWHPPVMSSGVIGRLDLLKRVFVWPKFYWSRKAKKWLQKMSSLIEQVATVCPSYGWPSYGDLKIVFYEGEVRLISSYLRLKRFLNG